MKSRIQIGKDIKKAREKLELTQVEVAKKAGLHFNYYARIERGDAKATLETLEKIFKVLKANSTNIPF